MAFSFTKYLWNLLDEIFHVDNYNDINGDPLLKRYLKNYEDELDEGFLPFIDNFLDLINVLTVDPKYLSLLAYTLGSPPSYGSNEQLYRLILAYAVEIYKIKGTKQSYVLLFNLLGVQIDIEEQIPSKGTRYDTDVHYDDDPVEHYDVECDYCSGYWIIYLSPIPENFLNKVTNLICFLEPINARFVGLVDGTGGGDDEVQEYILTELNIPITQQDYRGLIMEDALTP